MVYVSDDQVTQIKVMDTRLCINAVINMDEMNVHYTLF